MELYKVAFINDGRYHMSHRQFTTMESAREYCAGVAPSRCPIIMKVVEFYDPEAPQAPTESSSGTASNVFTHPNGPYDGEPHGVDTVSSSAIPAIGGVWPAEHSIEQGGADANEESGFVNARDSGKFSPVTEELYSTRWTGQR